MSPTHAASSGPPRSRCLIKEWCSSARSSSICASRPIMNRGTFPRPARRRSTRAVARRFAKPVSGEEMRETSSTIGCAVARIRRSPSTVHPERAGAIARARRLDFTWEVLQATTARECDAALSRRLLGVVETVTGSTRLLPSGAGHDAGILAPLFPVAMLFVRCREGLSHHPEEFVSLEDIAVALQVTVEFLRSWELS